MYFTKILKQLIAFMIDWRMVGPCLKGGAEKKLRTTGIIYSISRSMHSNLTSVMKEHAIFNQKGVLEIQSRP